MHVSILGAGRMGVAVARLCVRAGHQVALASRRDAQTMPDIAAVTGLAVEAVDQQDAVLRGDIVVLTIPWRARSSIVSNTSWFRRKIVLDAMNPYDPYPQVADLGGAASSEIVEKELAVARVVKTLNTMSAWDLARQARPRGAPLRIAVPLCGNDEGAKSVVARLVDDIGFDPVDIGGLENGRFYEPLQPLFGRPWTAAQLSSEFRRCTSA